MRCRAVLGYTSIVSDFSLEQHFIRAPNLPVVHGFSTRLGGVSPAPFASLNLGLSSGDSPENVAANRQRVLQALGSSAQQACAFHQVHSAKVVEASASWFEQEADAAVSNNPELLLIISTADCLPILFYDPASGAVGAAHCGWRGTVARITSEVITTMQRCYGTDPAQLRMAMGPAISGGCYQVGAEVIDAARAAGLGSEVYWPDSEEAEAAAEAVDGQPRFRFDLLAANRALALAQGVKASHIWQSSHCTYRDAELFYSYRRDRGVTGRHWAVVRSRAG